MDAPPLKPTDDTSGTAPPLVRNHFGAKHLM